MYYYVEAETSELQ